MDMQEKFRQLDEYYAKGDLKGAEDSLTAWVEEAEEAGNLGALLALYNELEGLYRTTKRADQAVEMSGLALELIGMMGLNNTVHHATTLLNGATANLVLGNTDRALTMYQSALEIFQLQGQGESYQMAALYNNISHCYQQKGEYDQALEYLRKALELVSRFDNAQGDVATTRTAIGMCLMSMNRLDEAEAYILESLGYYEGDDGLRDGHYSSALSAAGELYWRRRDNAKALDFFRKALAFNQAYFGDTHSNTIIRNNIAKIQAESEAVDG